MSRFEKKLKKYKRCTTSLSIPLVLRESLDYMAKLHCTDRNTIMLTILLNDSEIQELMGRLDGEESKA